MPDKQRVLLLISSMAGVGGTERMVHSLSMLLTRAGHEVHQATFDAPGTKRHFEGPVPLHGLGPLPRLPLAIRPLVYAASAWRLWKLKRKLDITVTISNLWSSDLISALTPGDDRKIALCHINVVDNPTNRLMIKMLPFVARIYRVFDRVIAVNEALAVELSALYRLRPGRIGCIENFADTAPITPALPTDELIRFVWCGRFSPEKNVDGLLHAWAKFSGSRTGVQLVLVGDGPCKEDCRALADRLDLAWSEDPGDTTAKLVCTGNVAVPASYMACARALLLSSSAEGLPMVILEALSLGVPVLAADCRAGGVRAALLGHGVCEPRRLDAEPTSSGALLPVPSPDAPETLDVWAATLKQACDDASLWCEWRAGARRRGSLFSSKAATQRWAEVLAFGGLAA